MAKTLSAWRAFLLSRKTSERRVRESSDFVFSITCLSIPGIWKKKYHSLCSPTALVNNPSLGATSESPARSPTWWVPCQFRREGGLLREERMRRGHGADKGGGGRVHPSLLLHHQWSTIYCILPELGVRLLRSFFLFPLFSLCSPPSLLQLPKQPQRELTKSIIYASQWHNDCVDLVDFHAAL